MPNDSWNYSLRTALLPAWDGFCLMVLALTAVGAPLFAHGTSGVASGLIEVMKPLGSPGVAVDIQAVKGLIPSPAALAGFACKLGVLTLIALWGWLVGFRTAANAGRVRGANHAAAPWGRRRGINALQLVLSLSLFVIAVTSWGSFWQDPQRGLIVGGLLGLLILAWLWLDPRFSPREFLHDQHARLDVYAGLVERAPGHREKWRMRPWVAIGWLAVVGALVLQAGGWLLFLTRADPTSSSHANQGAYTTVSALLVAAAAVLTLRKWRWGTVEWPETRAVDWITLHRAQAALVPNGLEAEAVQDMATALNHQAGALARSIQTDERAAAARHRARLAEFELLVDQTDTAATDATVRNVGR